MSPDDWVEAIRVVRAAEQEARQLWLEHMNEPSVVIAAGEMQAECRLAVQLLQSIEHRMALVSQRLEDRRASAS